MPDDSVFLAWTFILHLGKKEKEKLKEKYIPVKDHRSRNQILSPQHAIFHAISAHSFIHSSALNYLPCAMHTKRFPCLFCLLVTELWKM